MCSDDMILIFFTCMSQYCCFSRRHNFNVCKKLCKKVIEENVAYFVLWVGSDTLQMYPSSVWSNRFDLPSRQENFQLCHNRKTTVSRNELTQGRVLLSEKMNDNCLL